MKLADLHHYLPRREKAAHKGQFGHVLIIGGNYGMAGAVRMSGEAAARVGAGLVSVATQPEHIAVVSAMRPELMCCGIHSSHQLSHVLKRATVVGIGPGLGRDEWGKQLWQTVLNISHPIVMDADALHFLAAHPTKKQNWILTPHPGEAASLLKISAAEVQQDRIAAAHQIQNQYGGICVLKGAQTVVVAKEGAPYICEAGNPGMATGGMGDVLTGVIAGLLAQHMSIEMAAVFGVLLHATAGDLAAKTLGERGLLALDLMPYLHQLVNG